jgi:hypothetical protein
MPFRIFMSNDMLYVDEYTLLYVQCICCRIHHRNYSHIFACLMIIDGVWVGKWIYCTITTRNYKYL